MQLDGFITVVQEENHKANGLSLDKTSKHLQLRTIYMIGLLGQTYVALDEAMGTKKRKVEVSVKNTV